MDLNRIVKGNTNGDYEASIASEPSYQQQSDSVRSSPILQEVQAAPSLASPEEARKKTVQSLNTKVQLSLKLLHALKQKNLEDLGARTQIFKILTTQNESGQTLFQQVYASRNEADIRTVEATLKAIFHSRACCMGSKTSRGIFQLLEVLKPDKTAEVKAYLEEYIERLKTEKEIHAEQHFEGDVASLDQVGLYFVYGACMLNGNLLRALNAWIESQDLEVKAQFQEKIKLIFTYFLNDLKEPYCRAYLKDSSVYDGILLKICRAYPFLFEEFYPELLGHFLTEKSQGKLVKLLILKTPDHTCFLDLLYSKLEVGAIIKAQQASSKVFVSTLVQFENWLHQKHQAAHLIPVFRNLDLPHLLNYLLKLPLEKLTKDEKIRYLCLSICLKDIGCINRFKRIRIDTEAASQYFQLALVKLFQDLFEIDNEGKPLDRSLEHSLFNQSVVATDSKQLFFKILECLKSLDVLVCPTLMAIILSHSLKYDITYKPSSSTFNYVVEQLTSLGFNLHFKEPVKGTNLIFEAFDLENVDLIKKFIELGLNPFLLNTDGFSIFKIEKLLSQIPDRRDFYTQWKAQNMSVLNLAGLDKHPFLNKSFQENLFTTGEGLKAVDEQGRTPLMLLVKCNQNIQPVLRYLEMEDLEAKDHSEKTVKDYVVENNDQATWKLLENRIKNLRKKTKFRQFASLLVSNPQRQEKATSVGPKTNTRKATFQKPVEAQRSTSTVQEINLDYNIQTGAVSTTYTKREIQKEAKEKINKAERKKALKKERVQKQEEIVNPEREQPGKSLYEKAKRKVDTIRKVVEVAAHVNASPHSFVRQLAGKMGGAKNLERLSRAQTLFNLANPKPVNLLDDGSQLGAFNTLMDLVQIVLKEKLKEPPSGHILDTLGDIEEAIRKNPRMKLERRKVLEALQWIVGGTIEEGKGSHLNLRFVGGGLTIPRNRDQSENADIVYIRQAADIMERSLKALLLGYKDTIAQDTESFVSEKEESSES